MTQVQNATGAYYISPLQVITAAGSLTLAHGLPVAPGIVLVHLQCITAELNYSVGDIVVASPSSEGNNQGISIVMDAMNLHIRYGSGAGAGGGTPVYSIIGKTTGNTSGITNANWKMIFRAGIVV
jgi:hypothetical protein